ncbi:MAG: RNA polymerase sigma factor [Rhodobacterales bacterium]
MKLCRREVEKAIGPMLKYGYALCRDSDLACDLVQDSVVKALSAKNLPTRDESYRPWLFSILRNVFMDHLRSKKRLHEFAQLTHADDLENLSGQNIEESLINRMTVQAGLDRLSGQHRELLVLIDVSGFSYIEAAKLLDVPMGTVMSRLARARQRLRHEISTENLYSLETAQMSPRRNRAR